MYFLFIFLLKGYWIELLGNPPSYFIQEVDNSDIGKPNQKQWLGIVTGDSSVTMLNTDIALVRMVPDMDSGSMCEFSGSNACSHDTPFMPFVRQYLADTQAFLEDFRDVFTILINHGHTKVGECPDGQLCSFGFSGVAVSTDAQPVPSPTPAPVEPPSFGAAAEGGATLSLDKSCYNEGETIVAAFENISGTGVWIGIFPAAAVTDFTVLPAFESEDLKEWIFSCGFDGCHTWLSTGGVQLSTFNLTPGSYVAVISGPGGSSLGQAAVNFNFGTC
jgi:hypothetical protein